MCKMPSNGAVNWFAGRGGGVFGILVLILLLSTTIHYIFQISLGSIFIVTKNGGRNRP